MATVTTISDVVCPYCGCLCDDIEVIVEEGKIVGTRNACILGKRRFLDSQDPTRIKKPMIRVDGGLKEVSLEEAVQKAAEVLVKAERPLLYGWSMTECGAHQAGVALAEELGGIIDNTTSVCHGPSVLALQEVGISTCTLGEVKNRANLIVYWGCNPLQAHPRHLSRYTVYPSGFFREQGRRDRTLIVVDVRKTDTAKLADHFVQVEPGGDYELVSALRLAVNGQKVKSEKVAGVPREEIEQIAGLMWSCQFGALFFGLGVTMSDGKNRNIDNVLSLVRDLNAHTKFVIFAMRGHYNVGGFDEVLSWETGFPFAVDFGRGFPRYNPGETTSNDLLMRGEVDAALIVASDPTAHFPRKAVEHLAQIPIITIEPFHSLTSELASVVIPPAIAGIETSGTAYRMDHVPIRLREVVEPPAGCLPDRQIVQMILERVRALKRKGEE